MLSESTLEAPAQPTGQQPPAPGQAFLQLLFGKHIAYCLSAAARLGIADYMNSVPVTAESLAQRVGAHGPSLHRVMRVLASVGVFKQVDCTRFALTPVGELLQTSAPGSLRYTAIQFGDSWATRAFERFTDAVITGTDAISLSYRKNIFELFAELPDQAETFHRSMVNFSGASSAAILQAFDFRGIERLADVGGGHGALLSSILNRYPSIEGVLYDLPEVIAGASLDDFGAASQRVAFHQGSFFDGVPDGCDAYLLKHILHDWSDDHCRTILRHIARRLGAHGKLLVCELVLGETDAPDPAKFLDIEMLICTVGGRERTAGEFRALFASAGLRLERIVPTETGICVIEAKAASR